LWRYDRADEIGWSFRAPFSQAVFSSSVYFLAQATLGDFQLYTAALSDEALSSATVGDF
jgi:hypothetical protein